MEKIILTRFANEGFVNHQQIHLHSPVGKIEGSYAFIGPIFEELLSYTDQAVKDNPLLHDRKNETKHELLVDPEKVVYVKNIMLNGQMNDLHVGNDRDFIVIPVIPIVKEKLITGMSFPVSMDAFVPVKVGFAYKQLQSLLALYDEIKRVYGSEITVNTKLIDFCQCIVKV